MPHPAADGSVRGLRRLESVFGDIGASGELPPGPLDFRRAKAEPAVRFDRHCLRPQPADRLLLNGAQPGDLSHPLLKVARQVFDAIRGDDRVDLLHAGDPAVSHALVDVHTDPPLRVVERMMTHHEAAPQPDAGIALHELHVVIDPTFHVDRRTDERLAPSQIDLREIHARRARAMLPPHAGIGQTVLVREPLDEIFPGEPHAVGPPGEFIRVEEGIMSARRPDRHVERPEHRRVVNAIVVEIPAEDLNEVAVAGIGGEHLGIGRAVVEDDESLRTRDRQVMQDPPFDQFPLVAGFENDLQISPCAGDPLADRGIVGGPAEERFAHGQPHRSARRSGRTRV